MNPLHLAGLACMLVTVGFTVWKAFYCSHYGGQSPREAILESWFNIIVGFTINFLMNKLIFPHIPSMGHNEISNLDNFMTGWIYTVISMLRSYGIRRFFNWLMVRGLKLGCLMGLHDPANGYDGGNVVPKCRHCRKILA